MITFPKFIFVTISLTALFGGALQAEPNMKVREYRPLMAKSVRIEVASQVSPSQESAGVTMIREGWAFFDSRKWEAAIDKFLSAIEVCPRDPSAAEGLTMSLYRSGDYTSAVRLGEELAAIMPEIKTMVAKTALADMRFMVNRSELDAAREFAAYFPSGDKAYGELHGVLGNASADAVAPGGDGKAAAETGELVGN